MTTALNVTTGSPAISVKRWVGRGVMSVADQGAHAAANLVLHILLARVLGPREYGVFALLFAVFLFVSGFHNALVIEPLLIFGSGRYARRFGMYLRRVVVLHWLFSGIVGVLFVLAAGVAAVLGAGAVAWGLLALAGATPLILLQWLVRRACYCRSNARVAAFGSVGYLVLQTLGLAALYGSGLLSIAMAFVLMGAASLVSALPVFASLRSGGSAGGRAPALSRLWRRHWRYGKWVCLTAITQWVSQYFFYFMLPLTIGAAAVGHLRAIMNLIQPMSQMIPPLILLLTPTLVRHRGSPAFARKLGWMTWLMVAAGAAFWLLLWLVGEPLLRLVYGDDYASNAGLLLLLGLLPLIMGVANVWRLGLRARERTDLIFYGFLVGAAFTVTIGLVLVVYGGLSGAAAGIFLSTAIAAAVNGVQLRWMTGRRGESQAVRVERAT